MALLAIKQKVQMSIFLPPPSSSRTISQKQTVSIISIFSYFCGYHQGEIYLVAKETLVSGV